MQYEIILQNWADQIFEIVPGVIIAKLGRRDILNCDKFFLQNPEEEILEIAVGVSITKQGRTYI